MVTKAETTEESADKKVGKLALKSKEWCCLEASEKIDIIDEILDIFNTKPWSTEGEWTSEEMRLLGLVSDSSESNSDEKISQYPFNVASQVRYTVYDICVNFLKTVKSSIKHQINEEDESEKTKPEFENSTPELLSKKRLQNTPDGDTEIYGPVELKNMKHTFELWTTPSSKKHELKAEVGESDNEGITLVLGAGNQTFLTMIDVFHSIFAKPGKPVLLKLHPLRGYLYNMFDMILEPLKRRGFFDLVYDKGVAHTQTLLEMKEVSHVHLTGSFGTMNAIKDHLSKTRTELTASQVDKMVTSELGCSTPAILPLGKYTKNELKNAATTIVSNKKMNNGSNCLCVQVVIIPEKWEQKNEFKAILKEEFENTPSDPLYYPGSYEKYSAIVEHYDKGRVHHSTAMFNGLDKDDQKRAIHPVLIDCGVFGSENYDGHGLKNEAFGPILSWVELPSSSEDESRYLENTAIPFVNNKENIFGSLSCILFSPASQSEDELQTAISSLRYGSVCVNSTGVFPYMGMAYGGGTWGAFPRDKTGQSGNGLLGNIYGIPYAEKTVVYYSLDDAPLIDMKKTTPGIIFDALFMASTSKTNLLALRNVVTLLVVRAVSSMIPVDKLLSGQKHSYGAAL